MFQKYLDRGEMKTGCSGGFCGSGGWRPMGDKLDTGVGNGQVADVWLSLKVSLETFGQVQFSSLHFILFLRHWFTGPPPPPPFPRFTKEGMSSYFFPPLFFSVSLETFGKSS